MKFLSKFAQVALRVVGLVSGIGGTFQTLGIGGTVGATIEGRIVDSSVQIGGIIQQIELAGAAVAAGGPDKLKMALPSIQQVILSSAALSGHKVANPDLFKSGTEKITSGWVDVINSLHEDGIKVVPST